MIPTPFVLSCVLFLDFGIDDGDTCVILQSLLEEEPTMAVSVEWLKKINQEFRDAGIEPRTRPWEALIRYSVEFKVKFTMPSPIATEIFEWFESQSKPGAHHIGSLYESVYYFDAEFWTVSIPESPRLSWRLFSLS